MIARIAAVGTGFRRYFGVITTLLWQEEQNRRRAPMESIIALLEPVFLLSTLVTIWWFLGRRSLVVPVGNALLFYVSGFFAIYFFIYISRRMRGSVDVPARRFPIEQRLDHVVVHILLRVADYSLLGVLAFGGLYAFGIAAALPYNIVAVVQACAAIVMLGFGWGILNIILIRRFPLWGPISGPLNRANVLVSGVLFIPDFLAPGVRYVLSFNPLLHALALFRHGFYPNYPTLLLDTTYLAWCALIAVTGGLVLERVSRRSEQL